MRTRLKIFPLVFVVAACALNVFAQTAPGRDTHRLSPPGQNWALDVSLPGFRHATEKIDRDGRGGYTFEAAELQGKDVLFSFNLLEIRMEPAQFPGDAAGLRDFFVKKLEKSKGAKRKSIAAFEHQQTPAIRYEREYEVAYNLTQSYPVNLRQQSVEGYIVKDGVWIVIRLSAPFFNTAPPRGKDRTPQFKSILDTVRFVDTSAPSSSFDFFHKGKSLSLQGTYPAAVEALAAALKLERQNRQLDISHWRELVKHLTDAYGGTNDWAGAKETLDYGIGVDPDNPLFHLWLARLYAIPGELDNVIASLAKAFALPVDSSLFGYLPDPLSDPAFKRFKQDDKFRRAVKAMRKKKK